MNAVSAPAQLKCSIVRRDWPAGFETPNLDYVVTDEHGIVVAEGTSSSESWVRHDAGGYHTKATFDRLFPQGWQVNFDF
jgi:hypothetical protein